MTPSPVNSYALHMHGARAGFSGSPCTRLLQSRDTDTLHVAVASIEQREHPRPRLTGAMLAYSSGGAGARAYRRA